MKWYLCVVLLLLGTALAADPERTGFTITAAGLEVMLHPSRGAAEVTGKLTLRNDGQTALAQVFLQLTSTSKWLSVRREEAKPSSADHSTERSTEQFTEHQVRSDVDHTGALNEARIDLDRPLPAHASLTLAIDYTLKVEHGSARLKQAGAPLAIALATDWDRISTEFTAVRGAGYVLWYPAALEPALLAESNGVFLQLQEWRAREADSTFQVRVRADNTVLSEQKKYAPLGVTVPVLTGVSSAPARRGGVEVFATAPQDAQRFFATASTGEFVSAWLPQRQRTVRVWVLPEPGDAPYSAGNEIFVPTQADARSLPALTLYAFTHATLRSNRAWIEEGYAMFLDAKYREQNLGREAALDFLGERRGALALSEPENVNTAGSSLINSFDEIRYRTKAMFVWWMLHDLVGDAAVQRAIKRYRGEDDREASYMQKLLEQESHRDLSWLFNDWVYRDRGLAELSITAAHARTLLNGGFATELTIVNRGGAAASVPLFVLAGDEVKEGRVFVAAHGTASTALLTKAQPERARVNDGSVPETDPNNDEADVTVARAVAMP